MTQSTTPESLGGSQCQPPGPTPPNRLAGLQEAAVLVAAPRQDPEGLADLSCRVLKAGASILDEGQVLEWLLARCVHGDASRAAQSLLRRFGGLVRVLGATVAELRQVVSEPVALEIHLLHDVCRRLLEFPIRQRSLLSSVSAVEAYLRHSLAGRSRECFRVLYLDKANQLIEDALMGEGTIDHAPVYPREVMRRALEVGASACCLVHNHPTGSALPSPADIEITRRVVEAAKALAIPIHDHFLVAGDEVVSFRARGLIS